MVRSRASSTLTEVHESTMSNELKSAMITTVIHLLGVGVVVTVYYDLILFSDYITPLLAAFLFSVMLEGPKRLLLSAPLIHQMRSIEFDPSESFLPLPFRKLRWLLFESVSWSLSNPGKAGALFGLFISLIRATVGGYSLVSDLVGSLISIGVIAAVLFLLLALFDMNTLVSLFLILVGGGALLSFIVFGVTSVFIELKDGVGMLEEVVKDANVASIMEKMNVSTDDVARMRSTVETVVGAAIQAPNAFAVAPESPLDLEASRDAMLNASNSSLMANFTMDDNSNSSGSDSATNAAAAAAAVVGESSPTVFASALEAARNLFLSSASSSPDSGDPSSSASSSPSSVTGHSSSSLSSFANPSVAVAQRVADSKSLSDIASLLDLANLLVPLFNVPGEVMDDIRGFFRSDSLVNSLLSRNWDQVSTSLPKVGSVLFQSGIQLFVTVLRYGQLIAHQSISFAMFLVSLYYLLQLEYSFKDHILGALPLGPVMIEYLQDRVRKYVTRMFLATALVCILHALIVGLAFALLAVPFPWTGAFVAFFMALFPLISPYAIFIPISLFAWFVSGNAFVAIMMLVVPPLLSSADYYIYDFLSIDAHPFITTLSLVLGFGAFGIQGVLTGPALLLASIVLYTIFADPRISNH